MPASAERILRGGTIDLYTSHWRSPLLKDLDATIIGVSRGTPRRSPGYRYRVLRSLAPNDHAWAQQDREAFEEAYTLQLEEIGARAILERLNRIAGGRTAILLCWEKLADPGEWCHRQMLADYLRGRAGVEVRELVPGDLPRRPDAAQRSLFD